MFVTDTIKEGQNAVVFCPDNPEDKFEYLVAHAGHVSLVKWDEVDKEHLTAKSNGATMLVVAGGEKPKMKALYWTFSKIDSNWNVDWENRL